MNIFEFLESKITNILYHCTFFLILYIFFRLCKIPLNIIFLIMIAIIFSYIFTLWIEYFCLKRKVQKIINQVDALQEKYLITELLKKPKNLENQAYYYALLKATKAMNDKISELESSKKEYEEYIESFVHEIKTPLAAMLLTIDNQKNKDLKPEIDKIDELTEQILYYARSQNPEKDYFIKKVHLEDIIHSLILKNQFYLLQNKIQVHVYNVKTEVYTDEKWLSFILSQILSNAIKYKKNEHSQIKIYTTKNEKNLNLIIEDNGIGIKESELPRIFEKGFTGSNRTKKYATGMGLYLAKKLSESLNIHLKIESKYQEFTKVILEFSLQKK